MADASVRHPLIIERAAAQREQGAADKAPTMNCLRFMRDPRIASGRMKLQQSTGEFKEVAGWEKTVEEF